VFSSLDALEKKHQAFEKSRAKDDAETDKELINEAPKYDDTDTSSNFKRPSSFSGNCSFNLLITTCFSLYFQTTNMIPGDKSLCVTG